MLEHGREVVSSGAKLLVHHKNQCLTTDQALFCIPRKSPGVLGCEHGSLNEKLLCKNLFCLQGLLLIVHSNL